MFQMTKGQIFRVLILWLQTFISTLKGTNGSGKVTVQLINYKNSASRDINGDCCDNINWCINECDNYFRLCFAKTTSADKCALWSGWTRVLGGDSFSFPGVGGSFGNGVMNPLTYSFIQWQPILFSVEVWDEDSTSANDLIARYSLSIQTTPSPSQSTAGQRRKLSGKGQSYLNVDVKVFCDANFFIPDCSTNCIPRNDSSGHYTCDFTRGKKVCLSGWYGSDCLKYCVSRNDTLGHYSCDKKGQIKCLKNWYGRDCLSYCKARNDSLGRYSCDVNGQRKCLSGWHGRDCLTYCVSRNDSFGHYICETNGQKKCLDYWYGTNCLIYCKPRNDFSGHKTCNRTGHAVCLPGWQGEECTEIVIPRATFISSITVSGRTKGLQHQKSSSKVTSLPGVSGLRTDAFIFGPTSALNPFTTDKDSMIQPTKTTKVVLVSSQMLDSASKTRQPTSSFQHLLQSSASRSKRAVNTFTATPGGKLYTTKKQLISQPTETTRPLISSLFHTFSSLQPEMNMSHQVSSFQPNSSSRLTSVLKFTPTPSTGSIYSDGNLCSPKQSKRTKSLMTSSTLYSSLRQSVSHIEDFRSLTTSIHAWISMATPLLRPIHTKHKELTPKSIDITRVTSRSAFFSVLKQLTLLTSAHALVDRPFKESFFTKEMQITTKKRVPISPSTPSQHLASFAGSLCPEVYKATDKPTQPEVIPVSSGILMAFREKKGKELVVPRLISMLKGFLAKRLNQMCRGNEEVCNLSEDVYGAWFCPHDVNVQIYDVTSKGVSLKIASVLPSPLKGMVPSRTLIELLNESRECLENKTQTAITWIFANDLTTPRTRIDGSPDQLSGVSKQKSKSPLPYIMGIAGAVLILAAVLFVVRAKVLKRNMIYPDPDDELPMSPPCDYQANTDTIFLISRTRGKYGYKNKEKQATT